MNKIAQITILLLLSNFVFAVQPIACGKEWINIHKDNPKLVGIYASQLPDNKDDAELYKNAHPVSVYYLFSDKMVHWVSYTPTGQVQDGKWYSSDKSPWLTDKLTTNFKPEVFCAFWVK